jgi:hypothetical protein
MEHSTIWKSGNGKLKISEGEKARSVRLNVR